MDSNVFNLFYPGFIDIELYWKVRIWIYVYKVRWLKMIKKFKITYIQDGNIMEIEIHAESKSMAMYKFYMKHPSCDIETMEEIKWYGNQ